MRTSRPTCRSLPHPWPSPSRFARSVTDRKAAAVRNRRDSESVGNRSGLFLSKLERDAAELGCHHRPILGRGRRSLRASRRIVGGHCRTLAQATVQLPVRHSVTAPATLSAACSAGVRTVGGLLGGRGLRSPLSLDWRPSACAVHSRLSPPLPHGWRRRTPRVGSGIRKRLLRSGQTQRSRRQRSACSSSC
jgi:hypothetical protein